MDYAEIDYSSSKYQLSRTADGKPYELMVWKEPKGWVRMWVQSYKWSEPDHRPLGEGDRRTHVMAAFGYEWRTDAPEGSGWYRREYHGGNIVLRRL